MHEETVVCNTTDIRQHLWVSVYLKNCEFGSSHVAGHHANIALDAFDERFSKDKGNTDIVYPILEDTNVSVRVYNGVKDAIHRWAWGKAIDDGKKDDINYKLGLVDQIKTIKDVTDNISKLELMKVKGIGKHSLNEFVSVCKKYGINYE